MEKLCVFCSKFAWDAVIEHYGGTLTGGWPEGGMTCKAGHYCDENPEDTDAFRDTILRAAECQDYDPPTL